VLSPPEAWIVSIRKRSTTLIRWQQTTSRPVCLPDY